MTFSHYTGCLTRRRVTIRDEKLSTKQRWGSDLMRVMLAIDRGGSG